MPDRTEEQPADLYTKSKPNLSKIFLLGGLILAGLLIIIQFAYPSNRLPLFATIDGVNLNSWQKNDAIRLLDNKYIDKTVSIYFGDSKKAYRSPKLSEIGLTVKNASRINKIDYPWYLRIIPTSIFWVNPVINNGSPDYQQNNDLLNSYIAKELGDSCSIKPVDASLKASGNKLQVVPGENGGTCEIITISKALLNIKPRLNNKDSVRIRLTEKLPVLGDEVAQKLADSLQKKVGTGVPLVVNGSSQVIPANIVFGWMDFSVIDNKLTYTLNVDRATEYLNDQAGSKVSITAGITKIVTYNFTEISRISGSEGKKLDINGTLINIKKFIDGDNNLPTAVIAPVPPAISYDRGYSPTDTGISALIQQYAQDHSGTFGVSMVELSGKNRRAGYNEATQFTTASTYKLFVAYSALKRTENGDWQWSDQITDDKDLTTCFDDMIVYSDNACAEAMLTKIGHANVTNEANAIGCVSTSFLGGDGIKTTPADLALFLAELQNGQILNQSSTTRLIDAMKRNVYRDGIPAGISGATVADKVGFLDGLLHDASIVYSPTGTYVLVIMTDGSSWDNIADLAGRIEALRAQ